ncbi:MAG: Flp pilus assembly complex ATPase component TadA [Turicibacter sp.]|nr:Flp pilus assembly complex ATPase component TadA [Turicibacter sp.]
MVKKELIKIVSDAIDINASDIHFTLEEEGVVLVGYRAGSDMLPYLRLERSKYEQLLSYVRFNASLDLASPMQPQSGSLVIEEESEVFSCRVSLLPTVKFHSMVLRIINIKMGKDLEEIPFFLNNTTLLKEILQNEAGLILISGPTSSGKTTTAYALIDHLKNKLGKSVITIEDPIEYQQPDIVQMQVNENAGMNYDIGIKEILRHDPDVIVIGEIRDAITAKQAIRAALTGHLVISTVHSKDILGTIHRLLDLGVSVHDLDQSVIALVNQRLVPVGKSRKALMEICAAKPLGHLMEQVIEGSVITLPYTTLDEERLKWKSQKSKKQKSSRSKRK